MGRKKMKEKNYKQKVEEEREKEKKRTGEKEGNLVWSSWLKIELL